MCEREQEKFAFLHSSSINPLSRPKIKVSASESTRFLYKTHLNEEEVKKISLILANNGECMSIIDTMY